MVEQLTEFWRNEEGQDLVEYSLLMTFIALAAVALLSGVKTNLSTIWTTISQKVSSGATAAS